jgi:biopolymer transport protein ExbD
MPRSARRFGAGDPEVMLDINTTPLIDVMLVLLVMLIITIPIQLHAVHLELPAGVPPEQAAPAEPVRIGIDAKGVISWQGVPVDAGELDRRLALAARQAVPPEVHVRADRECRYAVFASVLAATRRNGLAKVAVVGSEQFGR